MTRMSIKDPTAFPLLTYIWVLLISLWGGITHHVHRRQTGRIQRGFWIELCFDLLYSSFSGVITFYLCQASGMDLLLTAAMVGIAGHMGSRLIFGLENVLSSWYQRLLNRSLPEEEDHNAEG